MPADSFYARLAEWRDVLVDDASYAPLYKDSAKGRPSIPPSLVVLTMLLQDHGDCSDAEAEARLRFDLRWKHALGLSLEDGGFDATVLCRFRRKLLDRGLERVLFERLVNAAREAGLLVTGAQQVVDSSHILGAAGVRDTYALIRGGIRKLLRALGYAGERRALLAERLRRYLDPTAPEKPELDWSDPAARAEHLRALVADARAALVLAPAETSGAAAREAAALLAKIVADDIEEGPPPGPKRRGRPPKDAPPGSARPRAPTAGEPGGSGGADTGPRLRQGTAPDRVLSVVDPELRVGHKSPSQRWAGYKAHLCEEPASELITAVAVRPANEHDAAPVVGLVASQQAAVGLRPAVLLADGAYGTADVRAELGALGMEVVAKLHPLNHAGYVGKDDFVVDLEANEGRGSVTCPEGVTTTERRTARDGRGRPVLEFVFPLAICAACPLAARCLGGPAGRVAHPVRPYGRRVQLHFHEAALQAARAAQRTPEQRRALRERLRPRAKVERKLAELLRRHGLRRGRYLGRRKTELQAVLTASAVNTKRLARLAATDLQYAARLRLALAA